MDENYFLNVTVPLNEDEEDATNDLTFGDIGDIKAGDEASDAMWKPDHQTLSSKIEVEKELFQRQALHPSNTTRSPQETLSNHSLPPNALPPASDPWWNAPHSRQNGASAVPLPSPPAASPPIPSPPNSLTPSLGTSPPFSLSALFASARAAQNASPDASVFSHNAHQYSSAANTEMPYSSPILPKHSVMEKLAALAQHTRPSPPHQDHPVSHPLSLPQPPMQSMHQHPQNIPPQMASPMSGQQRPVNPLPFPNMPMPNLMPPQAQQQQQRLTPQQYETAMLSYYENHTRELLQRHKETVERQLQEAQAAQRAGVLFDRSKFDGHQEGVRQRILQEHYARVNQLRFAVWRETHKQQQQLMQLAKNAHDQGAAVPAQPPNPDRLLINAKRKEESLGQKEATAENVHPSLGMLSLTTRSPTKYVRSENSYDVKNPEPERKRGKANGDIRNSPRFLEIEKQMAAAGLKPSKAKGNRQTFDVDTPKSAPRNARKKSRRLESMTEKDQELVFRVYLRQVESSVMYIDDYYNAMLKKKERSGKDAVFPDLAAKVHATRLRTRERGGEGRPLRARRSKGTTGQNGDGNVTASPRVGANSKALATALGTVQSWNPRAPRRVMDFAAVDKDNDEKEGLHKLLRDDDRVKVRQEIEYGYDLIANIHDIVRGESLDSLETEMKKLLATLRLDDTGTGVENRESRLGKNRFFATMCLTEKGRRYIAHVVELLDTAEQLPVLLVLFEYLGEIVFALRRQSFGKEHVPCDLMSAVVKSIQAADVAAMDCLSLLQAYASSHTPRCDLLSWTLRSSTGCKVLFSCMQRISRGFFKKEVDEGDLCAATLNEFFQAFGDCLQDIFDGAESSSKVWEVIAMVDTLSVGDSKTKFRTQLNKVMRLGNAPPPPVTKS